MCKKREEREKSEKERATVKLNRAKLIEVGNRRETRDKGRGWGYKKRCRVLKEREQITFNLTANSAGDWLEVEPTDCFCHWNSIFS